jgi:hypothetical protein
MATIRDAPLRHERGDLPYGHGAPMLLRNEIELGFNRSIAATVARVLPLARALGFGTTHRDGRRDADMATNGRFHPAPIPRASRGRRLSPGAASCRAVPLTCDFTDRQYEPTPRITPGSN